MATRLLGRVLGLCLVALAAPAHADLSRDLETVNWRVNGLDLIDCKASAFEKVRRLERLGIKAAFVVVRTETGGYHAIAVVDGHYALDNRRKHLTTVADLRAEGYRISDLNPAKPSP